MSQTILQTVFSILLKNWFETLQIFNLEETYCYTFIISILLLFDLRSIRNSQRSAMNNRATGRFPKKLPSSELPLPQTSTLRSRRRLANMLVAAALIFMFCWSPHVMCLLGANLGSSKLCPRIVTEYSLLLGKYKLKPLAKYYFNK